MSKKTRNLFYIIAIPRENPSCVQYQGLAKILNRKSWHYISSTYKTYCSGFKTQKRPPRPFLTRAACLFRDARWDSESTSECAVRTWQARTLNQCPFYRSENAPGPRRRDLDAARGMNLRTLRCKESVSPPNYRNHANNALFIQVVSGVSTTWTGFSRFLELTSGSQNGESDD